jgi:hypothetical protein
VLKLSQKRSSKTTKKRTRKRLYNILGERRLTTLAYHQIRIKKSRENRRKTNSRKNFQNPRENPHNPQKSAKNSKQIFLSTQNSTFQDLIAIISKCTHD